MSKVTLNNFPNMQILMCSGKNYLETSLFYTNLEYPEKEEGKMPAILQTTDTAPGRKVNSFWKPVLL